MVIGLTSGCDYIFRIDHIDRPPIDGDGETSDILDDTLTADARPSYACQLTLPTLVAGVPTGYQDPDERFDQLELYLQYFDGSDRDLYVATRVAREDVYKTPVFANVLSSANNDADPVLTEDGKTILFLSTRSGTPYKLFQATRATVADAFGAPSPVTTAANIELGIDVSPDGSVLYGADATGLLQSMQRTAGNAFGPPLGVGMNIYWPSVAGDGLTVYYARGGVVYRQTRMDTLSPFTGETTIIPDGFDPQISADGHSLIYMVNAVGMMRSDCL